MEDRPLTPGELEVFDRCYSLWCDTHVVQASVKTAPLDDLLKQKLVHLGAIHGLDVRFTVEPLGQGGAVIDQSFVIAVRGKK